MHQHLKISIRFFDDREVRAVWDEEHTKWWFSVLDIVGMLNNEQDYTKNQELLEVSESQIEKENQSVG